VPLSTRRLAWPLALLCLALMTAVGVAPLHRPGAASASAPVSPRAAHNDTSTPFNVSHLPTLIRHRYDGRRFRLDRALSRGLSGTSYAISYRSGALRVTGLLSVPTRPGRSPLVVAAHGFHLPERYHTQDVLRREVTYLTARGYVVLVPDYRNHGRSDRESSAAVAHPLGYAEDLINAVRAIRRAGLPFVDTDRVGLLGRSMGGGVALNAVAARPGLVDALALYSPVSSSAGDTYRRWVRGTGELDARVRSAYGRPATRPRFWHDISARSFVDRVDVPVQVHHGGADTVCPAAWSRSTVAALRGAGQTVSYFEYAGEGHGFGPSWPVLSRRLGDFFDEHV
jgi:dipeptidyl aminopeptidase/acylaminoacyl peptidase